MSAELAEMRTRHDIIFAELLKVRAERDEALADLESINDGWQRVNGTLIAERDAARARVAELEQAWRVINSTAPAAALKGDVK